MAKYKVNIPVGPIWNQEDAKKKCPCVCKAHGGTWTGVWVTPESTWGKFSIRQCKFMV